MACLNAATFCQENQAQDAPKTPQDAEQTAQDAPKTPQDAPKIEGLGVSRDDISGNKID